MAAQSTLDVFTVLACDLVTNEVIAELPTQNLRFGSRLKSAQPFSFVVPMGDRKLKNVDIKDATRPGQTAIYIDHQGSLVYGGLLWARSYQASAGTLSVNGNEPLSFYDAQEIPTTLRFSQVDQLEIARQVIGSITALPGGDIGLALDASMSGVLRDRTYYATDFKNVGEALLELSNVIGGFDYEVVHRYDSQQRPEKVLVFGYPRLGSAGVGLNRLFDFPGNLNDYTWPEDGVGFVDDMAAIGMGEGDQMKVGRAVNSDLIASGFPHYSGSRSYKDVSVQETLDGHAAQDLADAEHMFKSGTFSIQIDSDPVFGSYGLGDDARFRLTSDWHPTPAAGGAGFDDILRIFGWSVDGVTGEVQIDAGLVRTS